RSSSGCLMNIREGHVNKHISEKRQTMARQPQVTRGLALLDTPTLNKGTAFTAEERRDYGLEGLLPHAVESLDRQLERALQHLDLDRGPTLHTAVLSGWPERPSQAARATAQRDGACAQEAAATTAASTLFSIVTISGGLAIAATL